MILSLLSPASPLVPLAVPTLGTLTPVGTTALTVAWTNANSEATTEIWRDGALTGTAAKGLVTLSQTGLSAGVSYTFRIRHLMAGVYSPFTATKYAYTTPASPTGLAAIAIGNTVRLTWANPNPTLSTEIRDTGGALIATAGVGVESYDHTSLTDDTYVYKLRATDGTLYSAYTATAYATVNAGVQPPTSLARTVVGATVQLSWTNYNGTFQVRIYRDGALVTTQVATTAAYNDTGLSNATYVYTVRHYDGTTESSDSGSVSATVGEPDYATPTGLALSNADYCDRVTATWTDAVSQPVQVWRDAGAGYVLLATVLAGVQSYTDDGLTVVTLYAYKLRHYNAALTSSYTTPASLTTAIPSLTPIAVAGSWKLNKFTLTFTPTNLPLGGTINMTGATDDSGLGSGYEEATNISSPFDFFPTAYTITETGPSSGTITVPTVTVKNAAGTILRSAGPATAVFLYDDGLP